MGDFVDFRLPCADAAALQSRKHPQSCAVEASCPARIHVVRVVLAGAMMIVYTMTTAVWQRSPLAGSLLSRRRCNGLIFLSLTMPRLRCPGLRRQQVSLQIWHRDHEIRVMTVMEALYLTDFDSFVSSFDFWAVFSYRIMSLLFQFEATCRLWSDVARNIAPQAV